MMSHTNSGGIIQEIAFKLAEAKHTEQLQRDDIAPSEMTLFVLGSQGAGKTTIINKFLDKEPITSAATGPRPTFALDYAFVRKSTSTDLTGGSSAAPHNPHQPAARTVCHVWELGGGLLANSSSRVGAGDQTGYLAAMQNVNINHNLCDIPMRSARHGLRQLRIMLVLDLSKAECIWSDLMASLSGLDAMFDKCEASAVQAARLRRWQQVWNGGDGDVSVESGRMTLEYMPVPVLLVGGKYDVFQNFDPEIKKHICRALRSVALILGADLLFCSTHSAPQLSAVRDKLNKLTFRYHISGSNSAQQGGSRPARRIKTAVIDHNQALAIELGADSWQQIGHIPKQAVADVGVMLSAHIPQQRAATVEGGKSGSGTVVEPNDLVDPATDPDFREALIDELRAQKDAELRERRRDADVREKFHSMASLVEGSSDF